MAEAGRCELIEPEIGKFEKIPPIVVAAAGEEGVFGGELELFLEEPEHGSWELGVVIQAHGVAELAFAESVCYFFVEGFRDVVIELHLGIAGEFHGVGIKGIVGETKENIGEAVTNDVVEKHDTAHAICFRENCKAWEEIRRDFEDRVARA